MSEQVSTHMYCKEILYHFKCWNCMKWWSVGDWTPEPHVWCPHCGSGAGVEEVEATP